VDEPLSQAQNELVSDALLPEPNITDPNGNVTAQFPAAGTVVKIGSKITLTISETGP
jgi:beta-lactam-binding protein with PASTA domain